MQSHLVGRAALRFAAVLVFSSTVFAQTAALLARFDGEWRTTVSCPAKGKTEGYVIHFFSTVKDDNIRGEYGMAGEPGYLIIEGRIAESGAARLAAKGFVSARKYGTGMFTTEAAEYSYNVKAQFETAHGSGVRESGLGIVGRACAFDFVKQ